MTKEHGKPCWLVMMVLLTAMQVRAQAQPENVSFSDILALEFRTPDVSLSYGSTPSQFGSLWLPPVATKEQPFPVVIFVHGGCWLNAYDFTHSQAMTSALARQGFAVWSLEYRRTGDDGGGWPGSLEDVVAGINHLTGLKDYPLDFTRVAILGHSAGGHLAIRAAQQELGVPVRRVMGLAAIVDLETYARGDNSCQRATKDFMGGMPKERETVYAAANPVRHAPPSGLHLMLGDNDSIVPLTQRFEDGGQVKTTIINNAGHFDWLHPDTPAFSHLLATLKDGLKVTQK